MQRRKQFYERSGELNVFQLKISWRFTLVEDVKYFTKFPESSIFIIDISKYQRSYKYRSYELPVSYFH